MHIQRQRETFAYRYASNKYDPSANKLTDKVQGEFQDWWDEQLRQWGRDYSSRAPFGDWKTIERFLHQRYPAAYRGLSMGQEQAQPLLDQQVGRFGDPIPTEGLRGPIGPYETGPEAEEQHGYDPKEIASAMLLLHNEAHGYRTDLAQMDHDRLYDIAQKRYQMQRAYESRDPAKIARARRIFVAALTDYKQRQANSRFRFAADLVKQYTDQLYDEFHDWGKENKFPVHYDEWDYTKPMGGPLTYWDNIEGFLKDRYPAAHRDYRYGEENASDALDGNTLRMPARNSPWPYRSYHPPYETGPEAVAKYGYDPRQVAAGFMYLHTWSHAQSPQNQWRGDKLPRDIDRLSDIFQKRQQMQQHYENRTASSIDNEYGGELKRLLEPAPYWVAHVDGEPIYSGGASSEENAISAAIDFGKKKNLSFGYDEGGRHSLVDAKGNHVHDVKIFNDNTPGWSPTRE